MKKLAYIVMILIISSCNNYLPGFDFKAFNNTPLQELAKAVSDEDTEKIQEIVKLNNIEIDYRESEYGHSLLMLAVANNLEKSVNKLLELGANPNLRSIIKNDEDSSYINTPLFIACDNTISSTCNEKILNSLIASRANVNDKIEVEYVGANYKSYKSPLSEACKGDCLMIVKTLINSGAELNEGNYDEGHGPITNCIIHDRMEILSYLIIDRKAKIPKYCYVVQAHNETPRKEYTITQMLLKKNYKEDSEEFKIRLKILKYLKDNNLK